MVYPLNFNSNFKTQILNSLESFDLSLTRESCCHLGSFTDSSGVPYRPRRSVPVVPSNLFGLGLDSKSRMYGHRPLSGPEDTSKESQF